MLIEYWIFSGDILFCNNVLPSCKKVKLMIQPYARMYLTNNRRLELITMQVNPESLKRLICKTQLANYHVENILLCLQHDNHTTILI